MVASSKAQRLKPHAIDIRVDIDPVNWFLNTKEDTRSSYYLEDAATEFQVQGLELDWTCVNWDGDFRFKGAEWSYHDFRGDRWTNISNEQNRIYLRNAYRVLLTRARQGMIIFVPAGESTDPTARAASTIQRLIISRILEFLWLHNRPGFLVAISGPAAYQSDRLRDTWEVLERAQCISCQSTKGRCLRYRILTHERTQETEDVELTDGFRERGWERKLETALTPCPSPRAPCRAPCTHGRGRGQGELTRPQPLMENPKSETGANRPRPSAASPILPTTITSTRSPITGGRRKGETIRRQLDSVCLRSR